MESPDVETTVRGLLAAAGMSLTDEQVVQLVKQIPPQGKRRVLTDLTVERDQWANDRPRR